MSQQNRIWVTLAACALLVCVLLGAIMKNNIKEELSLQDIVGLVDDAEGYGEMQINTDRANFGQGEVLRLFANGNRRVYFVKGKNGYSGDLLIAVLVADDAITKIAGHDIKETPNYGTKVFKEAYLGTQYYGLSTKRDFVLTLGARPIDCDIVGVTNATITSSALLGAINAIIFYENVGLSAEG